LERQTIRHKALIFLKDGGLSNDRSRLKVRRIGQRLVPGKAKGQYATGAGKLSNKNNGFIGDCR
jgi:hypothetical protein